MEKEIEEAIKVINSGGYIDMGSLRAIFNLLEKGLHQASVGSISERCRALDRLKESRFWIQEGYRLSA